MRSRRKSGGTSKSCENRTEISSTVMEHLRSFTTLLSKFLAESLNWIWRRMSTSDRVISRKARGCFARSATVLYQSTARRAL
jgi:hypothetical protein